VADCTDDGVTVTIIVPAFNAAREITRTIESVLGQDLERIELVVVDDGSTDDTSDVAQAAAGSGTIPVRIVRQENEGVGAARNAGLEQAKGRYVFFLDADDFIDRQCLSRLYGKAESCNADIVFCGWDLVDLRGAILASYNDRYRYLEEPLSGEQAIAEMLKRHIWMATGAVLYRRSLLEDNNVEFAAGCTGGEDTEFDLRAMLHAKRLASVPEALTYCRLRTSMNPLEPDVRDRRRLNSLSAHYRLMKYFEDHGAEHELMSILESYVVGWILPSTIAYLATRGRHDQELAAAINTYLAEDHRLRAGAFDWMPSWKLRAKGAIGNCLLRLSPRAFCLLARLIPYR